MLTGRKVLLRAFRESDLGVLYRIFADLDTWAARSRRAPQPLTLQTFRDWYVPMGGGA